MKRIITTLREIVNTLQKRLFSFRKFNTTPPEFDTTISKPFKQSASTKRHIAFDWERLFAIVFSPKSRPHIHSLFTSLAIVISFFAIGKILALNLAHLIPTKVQKESRPPHIDRSQTNIGMELSEIQKANLFNTRELDANGAAINKRVQKNVVCFDSETPTTLPIKLMNTVVLQDSVKSIAAVTMRNASSPIDIREGDRVEGMIQVGKIDRLKLIFRNLTSGECEFISTIKDNNRNFSSRSKMKIHSGKEATLLMSKVNKMDGIENLGNTFNISKKLRDTLLQDTSTLLSQARGIQMKNPDGTLAYKITEIVPGSIYSNLNIQDGDIITAIDGKPIKNLNEILNLFGRIKTIDHLQIDVRRNGVDQALEYNFR